MKQLFTDYWYVLWGVGNLGLLVGAWVYVRRHPESTLARFFYFLLPSMNPDRIDRKGPPPLAIGLFCFGLFILLLANLFIPDFG